MKMAVLHVNSCNRDACSPTVRIANFIATQLNIPMIFNSLTAQVFMDTYDVLFVLHGVLLFSAHRDGAIELYRTAKKVVTISNDYSFSPCKRMSGHKNEITWSTVYTNIRRGIDSYINWNKLTWFPDYKPTAPKVKGLLYYGAYRVGREDLFRKYFTNPKQPTHIISYPKNHEKFRALSDALTIYKPFKHYGQLQSFGATLILQDVFSRSNWDCPANRFYEALFLNIPMYFDTCSINSFKMYGYSIKAFVINSAKELGRRIAASECHEIGMLQHKLWYRDYKTELISELHELTKGL
jgi:hypothetical protein